MRDRLHERVLRVPQDTRFVILLLWNLALWVLAQPVPGTAVMLLFLVEAIFLGDHLHYLRRRRDYKGCLPPSRARKRKPLLLK